MAPSSSATRTFPGDYESVFSAVCWAALESGMTVDHADRIAGIISLTTSMSFSSWGERIGVRVGQVAPGSIAVGARSELKFGLVDWGSNTRNLDRLFGQIALALGQPTG